MTWIIILAVAAVLVLWVISVQNKLVKSDQINANEEALKEISAKLIAVAEAYPDLKANQNYQQTMQSIEKYEENVRLARMTFNDTVTKFNNQVRMFPGSVVAGILGFAKRDYLAEDESKKDYPVI